MKKKIAASATMLYSLFALYYVFIYSSAASLRRYSIQEMFLRRTNFIPFKSMVDYIFTLMNGRINSEYVIRFFFGNLVILFPIGMAVAYFAKENEIRKCLFIGISVSFAMELAQLLLRIGSLDIDCIILRTTGMIFGALVMNYIYSRKEYILKLKKKI